MVTWQMWHLYTQLFEFGADTAGCYTGLIQPGCYTDSLSTTRWDRRNLHQPSKDVLCLAPSVYVGRVFCVPERPVRDAIPLADLVDHVPIEAVPRLNRTEHHITHYESRGISDGIPHCDVAGPDQRCQRVTAASILHRSS